MLVRVVRDEDETCESTEGLTDAFGIGITFSMTLDDYWRVFQIHYFPPDDVYLITTRVQDPYEHLFNIPSFFPLVTDNISERKNFRSIISELLPTSIDVTEDVCYLVVLKVENGPDSKNKNIK